MCACSSLWLLLENKPVTAPTRLRFRPALALALADCSEACIDCPAAGCATCSSGFLATADEDMVAL